MIFIADFIACSTCFGDHYAHHQELESIVQMVAACGIWCFGFQVVGMVWSWGLCVRFAGCCLKAAACKPDTYPSAPHNTDNLKTKAPNTTGSDHLYNTLELLMVDIMVPETCWASNKICNKYHLLHLVRILFPHMKKIGFVVFVLTTFIRYIFYCAKLWVPFQIRVERFSIHFNIPYCSTNLTSIRTYQLAEQHAQYQI